jgi:hypothetical protein
MALKEVKDLKKEALLQSAVEIPSTFRELIQTELDKFTLTNEAVVATGRAYEETIGNFLVSGSGATVYSVPSEVDSEVVITLVADRAVEVTARTTMEYTLNGVSGRWYRLKNPAGWVFGAELTEVKK